MMVMYLMCSCQCRRSSDCVTCCDVWLCREVAAELLHMPVCYSCVSCPLRVMQESCLSTVLSVRKD